MTTRYTAVFEFADKVSAPSVGKESKWLGGELCKVVFFDASEWHSIDHAPRSTRILVRCESGEIYAAHWVKNPATGHEAWCVSEAPDGTQHLCHPVEWREI